MATDRRLPSAWRTASSESSSVGNATASSAMGRAGQPSARSPGWVLLVFSMGCSTCLSHCSLDFFPRGHHDVRLAAWSAASKASCSQESRYKTPLMKQFVVSMEDHESIKQVRAEADRCNTRPSPLQAQRTERSDGWSRGNAWWRAYSSN